MLAIMLLSPALSRVWTPRIKRLDPYLRTQFFSLTISRIILDEIHTIGQQQGGVVWEQILLLAPCPVMYVSFLHSTVVIVTAVSHSHLADCRRR
jgi:hypothetical protein